MCNQFILMSLEYVASMYQNADNPEISADAKHWKSMMILYSSDKEVHKLNTLCQGVDKSDPESWSKFKSLFDDLFCEMREDIHAKTNILPKDIHYCSPYLPDEKFKRFIH